MPKRKQSSPYDDYDAPVPCDSSQGSEAQGPLPGYFDESLIHEFTEQYRPGNYQHCDRIMTEPMLRDLFNAHRDQDMTFTDPWLQYKQALIDQGYRFRPNSDLHCSVMYLLDNDIEELEEITY